MHPLKITNVVKQSSIIVYSRRYEFSSVHETGHTVCLACFPILSHEVMEKDHSELSRSNPIANLHSLYFTDEDILPRPSRIKEINIWYDEKNKRHDGMPYQLLCSDAA